MDAQTAKRRMGVMAAITFVAMLVAGGAAFGAIRLGVGALWAVFVLALAIGFAAQIWFIAGFRRAKEGV